MHGVMINSISKTKRKGKREGRDREEKGKRKGREKEEKRKRKGREGEEKGKRKGRESKKERSQPVRLAFDNHLQLSLD